MSVVVYRVVDPKIVDPDPTLEKKMGLDPNAKKPRSGSKRHKGRSKKQFGFGSNLIKFTLNTFLE